MRIKKHPPIEINFFCQKNNTAIRELPLILFNKCVNSVLFQGLDAQIDGVDLSSADTPQEILCAVGNDLGVHLDSDMQTSDIDARGSKLSAIGTHVPGKEESTFVFEAVLTSTFLENIVVTGD